MAVNGDTTDEDGSNDSNQGTTPVVTDDDNNNTNSGGDGSTPPPVNTIQDTTSKTDELPEPKTNRQRSGMFTNLQAYLAANKPQVSRVGQRFEREATGAQNRSQNQAQQASQNINEQVQQGSTTNQQLSSAQGFLSNIQQNISTDNNNNTPYFTQQNAQTQEEALKRLKAGYTGQNLQDLQNQNLFQQSLSQAQRAEDIANRTGTVEGREGLLRDFYRQPDYSGGEQFLDSLLLSGDLQTRSALNDLRNRITSQDSGALANVNKARNDAFQQAETNIGETQQRADDISQALANTEQTLTSKLEERRQNLENQFKDQYKKVNNALLSSFPQIGISGQGNGLFGQIDLGKYVKDSQGRPISNPNIQLGDVLTSQDVATAELLSRVTGNAPIVQSGQISGSPRNPQEVSVDWGQMQNDLSQRANTFMGDISGSLNNLKTVDTSKLNPKSETQRMLDIAEYVGSGGRGYNFRDTANVRNNMINEINRIAEIEKSYFGQNSPEVKYALDIANNAVNAANNISGMLGNYNLARASQALMPRGGAYSGSDNERAGAFLQQAQNNPNSPEAYLANAAKSSFNLDSALTNMYSKLSGMLQGVYGEPAIRSQINEAKSNYEKNRPASPQNPQLVYDPNLDLPPGSEQIPQFDYGNGPSDVPLYMQLFT